LGEGCDGEKKTKERMKHRWRENKNSIKGKERRKKKAEWKN
jgi:hypothetical protein